MMLLQGSLHPMATMKPTSEHRAQASSLDKDRVSHSRQRGASSSKLAYKRSRGTHAGPSDDEDHSLPLRSKAQP